MSSSCGFRKLLSRWEKDKENITLTDPAHNPCNCTTQMIYNSGDYWRELVIKVTSDRDYGVYTCTESSYVGTEYIVNTIVRCPPSKFIESYMCACIAYVYSCICMPHHHGNCTTRHHHGNYTTSHHHGDYTTSHQHGNCTTSHHCKSPWRLYNYVEAVISFLHFQPLPLLRPLHH